MLAEKVRNTNIGVGIGIVLEIIGYVVRTHSPGLVALGLVIGLVGTVIFIWGCMNYAEGKGYSPWLGLIGLLSCVGLIVLLLLPDKYKMGGPPAGGGPVNPPPGNWPPPRLAL